MYAGHTIGAMARSRRADERTESVRLEPGIVKIQQQRCAFSLNMLSHTDCLAENVLNDVFNKSELSLRQVELVTSR